MRQAKAFAPANVSCIFSLYDAEKSENKGSLGVGFTLDKGVVVEAEQSDVGRILVNGKESDFKTVMQVVKALTNKRMEIRITSELPFGCGFGLSGASALATSYAVNESLNLGLSKKELAMIAHVSEVENGTGRGDVGGQYNGGFMIKIKKEKPLEVERLDIKQKEIFYKVYGPIDTKTVINSKEAVRKINRAGDKALDKILRLKEPSFEDVAEISKIFAIESGLLNSKNLFDDMDLIERKGGKASMIMLGEGVFSNIPLAGYKKAMISKQGARVL